MWFDASGKSSDRESPSLSDPHTRPSLKQNPPPGTNSSKHPVVQLQDPGQVPAHLRPQSPGLVAPKYDSLDPPGKEPARLFEQGGPDEAVEREPHDPNQELIEAIEKVRKTVEASTEHVDYLDNGISASVDELRRTQKSGQ